MAEQYLTISHLSIKDFTRFFTKVAVNHRKFFNAAPCWEWTGGYSQGYGSYWYQGKAHPAHRILYAFCVEPVPIDLRDAHVDHLCENTHCVNPAHLQLTTPRGNALRSGSPPAQNARKTYCVNGHPLDAINIHITKTGARICRQCKRDQWRKSQADQVKRAADRKRLREYYRQLRIKHPEKHEERMRKQRERRNRQSR